MLNIWGRYQNIERVVLRCIIHETASSLVCWPIFPFIFYMFCFLVSSPIAQSHLVFLCVVYLFVVLHFFEREKKINFWVFLCVVSGIITLEQSIKWKQTNQTSYIKIVLTAIVSFFVLLPCGGGGGGQLSSNLLVVSSLAEWEVINAYINPNRGGRRRGQEVRSGRPKEKVWISRAKCGQENV